MLQPRSNTLWIFLISLALLFSSLYLWSTLFPGPVDSRALSFFKAEQIQAGRTYSIGPRLTYLLSFLLQVSFLIWFIRSGRAWSLSRKCEQWAHEREWLGILTFFLVVWMALKLISLPMNFFNGFYWQHLWGFSTQSMGSWWLDYTKEAGLDLLMSGIGVLLLFLAFRIWPRTWWMMSALFFSVWLIIQSVFWPIVVAPLFNRFEPIHNVEVTTMVHELAQKAGLGIDQILVMDASQRTTKANAYFAGLGETKRIVLYDNLLNQYSQEEVRAVIAHEMAHWQKGHIIKGLLLGILGSFILWGGAYIALRAGISGNHYPPMTWAVFLLFIMLASFASNPIQNTISRQMEVEADQTAVRLTGDTASAIRLQMNLSLRNRSDLSPPSFIEWFGYTHPSVLSRIEKIKEQRN
jgi:STE24 endopeptidase